MITVFERIPEIFVERYDSQFQTWAREFRRRGPKCAIPFDLMPGEIRLLDAGGRKIVKGCWLQAEVDRERPSMPRVVVKPATDHDAEMIERHSRDLRKWMLQ